MMNMIDDQSFLNEEKDKVGVHDNCQFLRVDREREQVYYGHPSFYIFLDRDINMVYRDCNNRHNTRYDSDGSEPRESQRLLG